MSKTNYLESQFVLWCLGKTNALFPTAIVPWFALFTGAPGESAAGTEVSTSGTAYARLNISSYFIDTFDEAGELKNVAPLSWPTATADWGTVVAGGIYPTSSSTQLLRYGLLPSGLLVQSGKILTIAAGQLLIREG